MDLKRFRARARGARLRELVALGLEAERAGIRLTDSAAGSILLIPGGTHTAMAAGIGSGSPPVPIGAENELAESHLDGLVDLLDGISND